MVTVVSGRPARPAWAGSTGRHEAVTVLRRRRCEPLRGATALRGRPRGAGGRSAAGPGAIPTCASAVRQASIPKGAEQEEWRGACLRCECWRLEGLRLGQAESEGHWQAFGVGKGAGKGLARMLARSGRRHETRPSSQSRRGPLGRAVDPAWVAVRCSKR